MKSFSDTKGSYPLRWLPHKQSSSSSSSSSFVRVLFSFLFFFCFFFFFFFSFFLFVWKMASSFFLKLFGTPIVPQLYLFDRCQYQDCNNHLRGSPIKSNQGLTLLQLKSQWMWDNDIFLGNPALEEIEMNIFPVRLFITNYHRDIFQLVLIYILSWRMQVVGYQKISWTFFFILNFIHKLNINLQSFLLVDRAQNERWKRTEFPQFWSWYLDYDCLESQSSCCCFSWRWSWAALIFWTRNSRISQRKLKRRAE